MPARHHLGKTLAALFLLILCSAVWGVFNKQRELYALEWLSKTAPKVAPSFQITTQEPGPDRQLVLLGDSRIADWKLPTIPGWRVINAGVPGLTSGELVLIAPAILTQHPPDAVVIQAGVNELKIIGVRSELYESLVSQCYSNLMTVVRMAEERGAQVLLTPVWPTGKVPWQRSVVWSHRIPDAIEAVNLRLRERSIGHTRRARLFDVFKPTMALPTVAPLEPRLRDTLHFTPDFYEQLTERLIIELKH